MSSNADTGIRVATAGQGKLARVIATRGGTAAPEAPFVIEHREALIYMLCEAAELEHTIMCQYLFAAFSLKQHVGEGLTEEELAAVTRWRRQVSHVATQEMLHLALVQNILSAIGAAPHFARPNLPAPASHYPAGVQLALLPFGEQALRHFMFLERPEGMDLADADGLAAVGRAQPALSERDIVPRGQDFATVGHLYRSIEAGLARLAGKHGEAWLFVGPPRAQATAAHFRWPELVAVTDLASGQRVIEEILEQGEGARGDWRDAHFGQFVEILDEYQQLRQARPGFDPVRPVLAANVRPPERDAQVPLITDPLTARVTDLFNVTYEILLQIFERYFAHTQETDEQLKALADATITLMARVIKPLGDLITTLPAGPEHEGNTAGPSFELFYESDYLMPHRQAAWALLTERLDEAGWLCGAICEGRGQRIAGQLQPALAALRDTAQALAAHLPAGSAQARQALSASPATTPTPEELDRYLVNAATLADAATTARPDGHVPRALVEVLTAACAAVTAAVASPSPGTVVARLCDSVLRPLAAALGLRPAGESTSPGDTRQAARSDHGQTTGSARRDVDGSRQGQPGGTVDALVWRTALAATQLRARLADVAPPELAEAVAALQDLAIRLAPANEETSRLASFADIQHGLRAQIQVATDGPYLATNVPRLRDHLGNPIRATPQLALCRCGGSAIKPFCDGTHARTGFSGAKDPQRVPDRRDIYLGQELTILDNRGICQHSGLCTDRLATVFRTGADPFVAPSGGRMDEIIRAVRDCPSGALSYAIDGREAHEQADWGNTREAAIEVTKDGPYRITGGITVTGADGNPMPRALGASAEHCTLCRCGHSQNKPFCSGMHWYVGFTDPPTAADPAPFEWAGGLPALTRMSRLLYEKHVPADPLLAPMFADMPPDQSQRLAGWLARALGGPGGQDGDGGVQQAAGFTGEQIGEQHRARWVLLASTAAEEAGLPGDREFRSVFSSCLEWMSRAALAGGQLALLPCWDWGPGGPPAPAVPAAEEDVVGAQQPLPGPDQPVSFAAHIKPLFRQRDRQSMSFAFDLWSYDDVHARAADILARLQEGSMPCDGAWDAAKIEVFQRWTTTGTQP
jgi:CDGSH-type Zn-finger protein/truncated hemoglobin YjbI